MLMTIKQSIKYHKDKKKYCVVIRKLSDGSTENSKGYILDYSPSFILMQEVYDFIVMGYLVFPVSSIDKIRNNNNDKYLNKIHKEKPESILAMENDEKVLMKFLKEAQKKVKRS